MPVEKPIPSPEIYDRNVHAFNPWRPGFLLFYITALICIMVSLIGCRQLKPDVIATPTLTAVSTTPIVPTHLATKMPQETNNAVNRVTVTPVEVVLITDTPDFSFPFELCSPLADHPVGELQAIVSSPYDPPPMGKDDRHQGVDFAFYNQGERSSIEKEGIQAVTAGRVACVVDNRLPYGNMVILETAWKNLPPELRHVLSISPGESLYHLYAHMDAQPLVSMDSRVECGQLIGFVGKSGYNVPVAHLHLETRIGPSGMRFDGMVFYDTRANKDEMENYKTWRMSGIYRHFDPMNLFDLDLSESVEDE